MNSNFVTLKTLSNVMMYDIIENYLQPIYVSIIGKLIMYQTVYKNLFCTVTITNSVFIQTGNGKDRNAIYGHHVV